MKRWLAFLLMLALLIPHVALAQEQSGALKAGDKGDDVLQLQQRLSELFLSSGKADGIYGKQTAAAVKEAQRLLVAAGYGIEETGIANNETLRLLYDPEAEHSLRTLRPGSRGKRVTALQNRLLELKLLDGSADGAYGRLTAEAVMQFQLIVAQATNVAVSADGVATPEVYEQIMGDVSQYGFKLPSDSDDTYPRSLTAEYLYSKSCILLDAPSGEVLFANNEHKPLYPASTTKMMTLLLAIEQNDLDRMVVIPECAADVPVDSSLVPIYAGEEMRMRDLLYGLMIRSGNDAANAVAQLTGGSIEAFVSRMNERATELGMNNTHFVNPHGYHNADHMTTAHDLAVLARYGLTNADFAQISTCLSYQMPATALRAPLLLENRYEIFDPASPYYIEGAAGVKSGYTSHAGFCYVGAAQDDGRTLIAVVLGARTRNQAWTDLKRLFAYGFAAE